MLLQLKSFEGTSSSTNRVWLEENANRFSKVNIHTYITLCLLVQCNKADKKQFGFLLFTLEVQERKKSVGKK